MSTFPTFAPGSVVRVKDKPTQTFTVQKSEKRGRWEYVYGRDEKSKPHEFTAQKLELVHGAATKAAPEKAPKAPKAPKPEKAPRAQKAPEDLKGVNPIGFAEFRTLHPPVRDPKLGRRVQHNGDNVAEQLTKELRENGDDLWACPLVKKHLGSDIPQLRSRYASLNPGMVRMNVANLIRGAIRRAAE